MAQFLINLQVTRIGMLTEGPTPEEAQIVSEHFAHLQRLQAAGVLILAGRTLNNDETTMGLAIINAEDEAAAQAILASDPVIINNVMRGTIFPYRVALISEGNAMESSAT